MAVRCNSSAQLSFQDQLDVSNFSQPLGSQSFDPSDSINQPSLNVTNSNSITSNQSEAHIPDRGSPCQPTLNDRVKQEKSSPLPSESNGSTHTSSNVSSDISKLIDGIRHFNCDVDAYLLA